MTETQQTVDGGSYTFDYGMLEYSPTDHVFYGRLLVHSIEGVFTFEDTQDDSE